MGNEKKKIIIKIWFARYVVKRMGIVRNAAQDVARSSRVTPSTMSQVSTAIVVETADSIRQRKIMKKQD